jgi:hypothetical protein
MWICFCCNDQRYLKRKISKWSANSKNKAVLTAMLVKSQKVQIFQVGKRNIQNQKIIDKWSNAEIALLRPF